MERHDIVVVGGGPGGYAAALHAASLGMSVALVERDRVGGTCLNRGCIPTKVLVRAGRLIQSAAGAGRFGVRLELAGVDLAGLMAARQAAVERLVGGVEFLLKRAKVTVHRGTGRLLDPNHVRVDEGGVVLAGRQLVIATGSAPGRFPPAEADGGLICNSDHALQIDRVPERLAIVGAGAIGIEFAYIYRMLGSQVTLVEALDGLLPMADADVRRELERHFRRLKIAAHTSARVTGVERRAGTVSLSLTDRKGRPQTVEADRLLVATGRRPLPPEGDVALPFDPRGFIRVDERLRVVGHPTLWAIGDAKPGTMLAHAATREGIDAVERIAGREPAPLAAASVPACIYSEPQVAWVGPTGDALSAASIPCATGTCHFRAVGKAVLEGEDHGFVKLIADPVTGRVLSAHLIGPEVTELVGELSLAVSAGLTVAQLAAAVHAHPTLHEAVGEAARELAANLRGG